MAKFKKKFALGPSFAFIFDSIIKAGEYVR